MVARGFRVATFDLLGQGASDKPALFISQDDQVAALALLIDQLGDVPIFLGGISFGGLIALRYAIDRGDRLAGLALMSSFAELSPQLLLLGNALRTGLILNGEFDFLTPRSLHETLRLGIPDSALVIIPRAFHAFTLEKPALTADLLCRFAEDVLARKWKGDRAVWIAPEKAGEALIPFPRGHDHLRAIPAHAAPP